jgi:hypothetical protein
MSDLVVLTTDAPSSTINNLSSMEPIHDDGDGDGDFNRKSNDEAAKKPKRAILVKKKTASSEIAAVATAVTFIAPLILSAAAVEFINIIRETLGLYMEHGARSSAKVNHFHRFIQNKILQLIRDKPEYRVELEYKVAATNSSGLKRCDIVVLKNNIPHIVFPVKIISSNYKQNKNNSWENLTGELQHLVWANDENLNIIPINIFMNKTPYLNTNKKIKNFETITFDDIKIYNTLITKKIAYDVMNYIMVVEHQNNIGDNYDKIPNIIGFDVNTPFRELSVILEHLL